MNSTDHDTTRRALAFSRAFINGDKVGATTMLMTLPVDDIPSFAASTSTILKAALEAGNVPAGPFFDTLAAYIDKVEG